MYTEREWRFICHNRLPDHPEGPNHYTALLGWGDHKEDSLLGELFGTESTLRFEDFVETCSTRAKWIFSAPEVRRRDWQILGYELKHFENYQRA